MGPVTGARSAVIAAVVIVVTAVVAVVGPADPGDVRPGLAVVVAAALVVWLAVAAVAFQVLVERAALRVPYYVGLLAMMTAAVVVNPWAVFGLWIVSVYGFALFSGRSAFAWTVVGALLLTMVMFDDPAGLLPVIVSLLSPLVVAGAYLAKESEARRRANRELETTQAANTALARSAGVRAERQRVAREIHDTLAQDLSAAVALLEGEVAAGAGGRVAQARDLTRRGLAEARRSIRALAPEPLDEAPLPAALDRLVRQWAEDTGIDSTFDGDPLPARLSPAVESAVYRVGQSALANVAEHAAASRVRLTLSYVDGQVVLDVRDDGVGFDPGVACLAGGRGFGLRGMRQRVGELGGTLDVETGPGLGTAIRAAVPLAR